MTVEEAREWMNAPGGVVTMRREKLRRMEAKAAWHVNEENVRRWRKQSTSISEEDLKRDKGYWKCVAFVLTEHLLGTDFFSSASTPTSSSGYSGAQPSPSSKPKKKQRTKKDN